MNPTIRILIGMAAVTLLASCATVETTPEGMGDVPSDGLVYYMPMRPIVVKITRGDKTAPPATTPPAKGGGAAPTPGKADGATTATARGDGTTAPASETAAAAASTAKDKSPSTAEANSSAGGADSESPDKTPQKYTIEVKEGDAYADLSKRYVLRMPANALAKRSIKIGVTPQGLLGSATAESKSQASEVLKALAASKGIMGTRAFTPDAKVPECELGRTYTLVLPVKEAVAATEAKSLCGFEIRIERFGGSLSEPKAETTEAADTKGSATASDKSKTDTLVGSAKDDKKQHPGVFYRQALPYLVKVSDPKTGAASPSTQFLVYSPSDAPVLFLPAKKSLFAADNKMDVAFTDGVLTSYSQDIDGEVVALAKLPADILGAYFEAIGAIFPKKTSSLKTEKEYLEASNALALAKLQEQKCRDVLDNDNSTDDEIKTACGGGQ